MIKRLAWEKNWLLQHQWSVAAVARLEQTDDQTPVEYLTNRAQFRQLELIVDRSTLIPRLETEQLVAQIIAAYQQTPVELIVEIGTGSGAIALALAQALPKVKIIATEIDARARQIAQQNIDRYQLGARITLIGADLLSAAVQQQIGARQWWLVANLPYIPHERLATLDPAVINYEPLLALDGGADGLVIINRLLTQISAPLTVARPLAVYLEVDDSHTLAPFQQFTLYRWQLGRDWQGKPRFISGKLLASNIARS